MQKGSSFLARALFLKVIHLKIICKFCINIQNLIIRRTKMRISYELIEFPSPFTNGNHQLDFTWLEVIHAAITLGRRNWNDVISHPNHSIFDGL